MKQFMIGALAALAMLSPALAEDTSKSTIHPIGVVSQDTPVRLIADEVGIFGKFKADSICTLHTGDVVAILGTADGKQLVQRTAKFKVKMPDKTSCPIGATATVDPLLAKAWQAEALAKDAAKAAKKGS